LNIDANQNENIIMDNTQIQNFKRIDNEYEKKFGRLYKTFDVRMIKNKIWESVSSGHVKNETNFKYVIESIQMNLEKEVLNNISTPTCFVCLLHLANEKSKYILLNY
jgi:hypothetical protein